MCRAMSKDDVATLPGPVTCHHSTQATGSSMCFPSLFSVFFGIALHTVSLLPENGVFCRTSKTRLTTTTWSTWPSGTCQLPWTTSWRCAFLQIFFHLDRKYSLDRSLQVTCCTFCALLLCSAIQPYLALFHNKNQPYLAIIHTNTHHAYSTVCWKRGFRGSEVSQDTYSCHNKGASYVCYIK